MDLSRFIALQLLSTFAIALADEWSVLPAPAQSKPQAAAATNDWQILDSKTPIAEPAPPSSAGLDWSILSLDGNPDKGKATDGRFCLADCVCGLCDCGADCFCCGGYAKLEAEALKSGKSAIIYIGTRGEDADAARREAKARGMLFLAAKSLAGIGPDGKPAKFPAGTHELKPVGADLFFVPREPRRIPIPDKQQSSVRWLTPEECAS